MSYRPKARISESSSNIVVIKITYYFPRPRINPSYLSLCLDFLPRIIAKAYSIPKYGQHLRTRSNHFKSSSSICLKFYSTNIINRCIGSPNMDRIYCSPLGSIKSLPLQLIYDVERINRRLGVQKRHFCSRTTSVTISSILWMTCLRQNCGKLFLCTLHSISGDNILGNGFLCILHAIPTSQNPINRKRN